MIRYECFSRSQQLFVNYTWVANLALLKMFYLQALAARQQAYSQSCMRLPPSPNGRNDFIWSWILWEAIFLHQVVAYLRYPSFKRWLKNLFAYIHPLGALLNESLALAVNHLFQIWCDYQWGQEFGAVNMSFADQLKSLSPLMISALKDGLILLRTNSSKWMTLISSLAEGVEAASGKG